MKLILLCPLLLIGNLVAQVDQQRPMGIKLPENFADLVAQQNKRAQRILSDYSKMREQAGDIVDLTGEPATIPPPKAFCTAEDKSFDARDQRIVSQVADQGTFCGSCWAFASTANMESAELKINRPVNPLSEQELLACSGGGDCSGGIFPYEWIRGAGMVSANALRYDPAHVNSAACSGLSAIAHLKVYGFLRSDGSVDPDRTKRVQALKSALCQYGTLSVMMAGTPDLQSTGSGIYSNAASEQNPYLEVNHAVQLIGWDDASQSWLVKNSWGTSLGDQGFFHIRYGSSWFGYAASWATALEEPFTVDSHGRFKLKGGYMSLKNYKKLQREKDRPK